MKSILEFLTVLISFHFAAANSLARGIVTDTTCLSDMEPDISELLPLPQVYQSLPYQFTLEAFCPLTGRDYPIGAYTQPGLNGVLGALHNPSATPFSLIDSKIALSSLQCGVSNGLQNFTNAFTCLADNSSPQPADFACFDYIAVDYCLNGEKVLRLVPKVDPPKNRRCKCTLYDTGIERCLLGQPVYTKDLESYEGTLPILISCARGCPEKTSSDRKFSADIG